MFINQLSFEEESLLVQLLNGENLSRKEIAYKIATLQDESKEQCFTPLIESLLNKIKSSSDYEFENARDILNEYPEFPDEI